MHLKQLLIERPHSYSQELSPLKGTVTVISSNSEQIITLSATTMNQIFKLIALDCSASAKRAAEQVERIILDAGAELELLENNGTLLIEG